MVLAEITPKTIQVIRSHLVSSKEGLATYEIIAHYKDFFGHRLGNEQDVEDWLSSRSDLCRPRTNCYGQKIWGAVLTEETAHVQKMVQKQKAKPKKKGPKDSRPISSQVVCSGRRVVTRSQAKSKLEPKPRSSLDYNRNMLFPDPYRVKERERMREKEYRSEMSDGNYDVNRSVGSSLASCSRSPSPVRPTKKTSYKEHEEWTRELNFLDKRKRTEPFSQRRESVPTEQLETLIIHQSASTRSESSSSEKIIPKSKRRLEMNQKAKTTNQKQATTDGMRKFLTDQIRKNGGEIEFEELLKFFNMEFMVTRLKKRPISSEKFGQIVAKFPEMVPRETHDGPVIKIETEDKNSIERKKNSIELILERLTSLEISVNQQNERHQMLIKIVNDLKRDVRTLPKVIVREFEGNMLNSLSSKA